MELELTKFGDKGPSKTTIKKIEGHHNIVMNSNDIVWLESHICEAPHNFGIFCVYDEELDPALDFCCYCGNPWERK